MAVRSCCFLVPVRSESLGGGRGCNILELSLLCSVELGFLDSTSPRFLHYTNRWLLVYNSRS